MNINAFLQKDYENEPPSGPQKQTQNKANFFKGRAGLLTDLKILVTVQSRHR